MTIPQENSWHRRESLYNKFIAATAERYANALTQESDDPNALMKLYALVGKMRLIVPESVIAAAEAATINVQKAYEAPNRSLRQIHIFWAEGDVDPLLGLQQSLPRGSRDKQGNLVEMTNCDGSGGSIS